VEDVGGSDNDDNGVEPTKEIEIEAGPRRLPYHELIAATRSFAPEEKLRQGGFGSVYRGPGPPAREERQQPRRGH
jgi:hypothetical protein